MKYFAKVENNLISNVIVLDDISCKNFSFPESEPIGQIYIQSLGLDGDWLETSIDGSFRQRYAIIGGSFDNQLNCFVNQQPYPSWVKDNSGKWNPPVDYPAHANEHDVLVWNEESLSWLVVLVG